jgi:hypothetical protein
VGERVSVGRVGRGAPQQRRDVVEAELLDERRAVLLEVPPLKDLQHNDTWIKMLHKEQVDVFLLVASIDLWLMMIC